MTRNERADLFCVLGTKHRARRIEQSAAARERRPQRFEQPLLLQDETREVAFPTQPFAIGMTADNAGRRARNIGEDAIEWLAVPPRFRFARVARDEPRGEPEPSEVLRNALES